jgi:hypothetical protein
MVSSLQVFCPKFCTHFSYPYACYIPRPSHIPWLITLIICGEYKLWSSLCGFCRLPVTSSLQYLSRLLCFQTPWIITKLWIKLFINVTTTSTRRIRSRSLTIRSRRPVMRSPSNQNGQNGREEGNGGDRTILQYIIDIHHFEQCSR